MLGIHVNTLSRAQRETIGCRLLSTGELLELHAALDRAQRLRRRAWRRAAVLSFALDAALLGMTAYAAGLTPAVAFAALAVTALVAVCLAAAWVMAIGVYAGQFNRAVERGYPELADRCRL